MPVFYASEVAALLGLNRFKPKDEALFRVLSNMPRFKPLIERIKETTGGKTCAEIINEAPQDIKVSLDKAVGEAVKASSQKSIESTMTQFKQDTTNALLTKAIEGKDAPSVFKTAATRILKKETTYEQEVKTLESSTVVDTLTREIQKQRGTRMESAAEDKHAADTGKAVTDRGASGRFECDEYILVGFIDGMQDGKIVETKNRKRFWKEPPNYDLVQLRCYMRMKGKVPGVLLECFPSGETRKTVLEWDDSEWDAIHSGLVSVASEIASMTADRAESIVRKCLV